MRSASSRLLQVTALCLALIGTSAFANAQETIDPDRPDLTNSATIVETGALQIELGGIFTRDSGDRTFGSPLTARIGLRAWLEARVGTDGFVTTSDGHTRATGLGNVQLGAKLRLVPSSDGPPHLSILPTVTLPTASSDLALGSGDADFTLGVLSGANVSRWARVDVNYGIGSIGGGDRSRFTQHLVSLSASTAIGTRWSPFLEGFCFSREDPDGGALAAIDLGALYRLSDKTALDGGALFGVTDAAPSFGVFAGLSFVVGHTDRGLAQHQGKPHQVRPRPVTRRR